MQRGETTCAQRFQGVHASEERARIQFRLQQLQLQRCVDQIARIAPRDYFRTQYANLYADYHAKTGLPRRWRATGRRLTNAEKRELERQAGAHQRCHAEYLRALQTQPDYVEKLENQYQMLIRQLQRLETVPKTDT